MGFTIDNWKEISKTELNVSVKNNLLNAGNLNSPDWVVKESNESVLVFNSIINDEDVLTKYAICAAIDHCNKFVNTVLSSRSFCQNAEELSDILHNFGYTSEVLRGVGINSISKLMELSKEDLFILAKNSFGLTSNEYKDLSYSGFTNSKIMFIAEKRSKMVNNNSKPDLLKAGIGSFELFGVISFITSVLLLVIGFIVFK